MSDPVTPTTQQDIVQEGIVSPFIIQKYLFLGADKISSFTKDDAVGPNIKRLDATAPIDEDKTKKILFEERQLMSGMPIPNAEVALEAFGDVKPIGEGSVRDKNFQPSKEDYTIKTFLTFQVGTEPNNYEVTEPGNTSFSGKTSIREKLKKHRDELITGIVGEYQTPAVITKLEITNRAKDAFTNRSNYLVKLTINFTFIEDLYAPTIKTKKLDGGEGIKKMPIQLIYPNYSEDSTLNTKAKTISDQDGLILALKFIPSDSSLWTKTKANFPNGIYRNFHLTYSKHTFSLFNQNEKEQASPSHQHELVIEYVSYEADSSPKKFVTEGYRGIQTTDNIFTLLTAANVTSLPTDIKGIKTLADFETSLTSYVTLINAAQQNLQNSGYTAVADNVKAAKTQIKENQQKIHMMKVELRRTLWAFLLSKITIYELKIPYETIGYYEVSNDVEDYWSTFSVSEALSSTLVGAQIGGSVGGPIGAGVGAAVTGVGDTVKQIIQASNTKRAAISPFEQWKIRDSIKSENNIKSDVNFFNQRLQEAQEVKKAEDASREPVVLPDGTNASNISFSDLIDFLKGTFTATGTNIVNALTGKADSDTQAKLKAVSEELAKESSTRSQETSVGDTIIKYIKFGQLLELLNLAETSKDLTILVGGKPVEFFTGVGTKEYGYLNYYDLPIYFPNLLSFLQKKILERTDINYPSDVFIREAFETLITPYLQTPEKSKDDKIGKIIPANLRIVSSLHYDNTSFQSLNATGSLNLLNDSDVRKYKNNFLNSKFPGETPSIGMKKILLIGAESSLENINFFGNFKIDKDMQSSGKFPGDIFEKDASGKVTDWGKDYKSPEARNYNTKLFQKWIIHNTLMPCILLSKVSAQETMLKSRSVKFSRNDNPNLLTGQILDDTSLLRMPYSFDASIRASNIFFLDVGSYMFLAPMTTSTTFGFTGAFVITDVSIVQVFANFKNSSSDAERIQMNIKTRHITYGDGLQPSRKDGATTSNPGRTNPEPAAE